mgnify:CR=1 FL=1
MQKSKSVLTGFGEFNPLPPPKLVFIKSDIV